MIGKTHHGIDRDAKSLIVNAPEEVATAGIFQLGGLDGKFAGESLILPAAGAIQVANGQFGEGRGVAIIGGEPEPAGGRG